MDCILRSLDNPLLSGLSLGLSATKEGQVSINPQFFPCCGGEAQAFDVRKNGFQMCALKGRLSRLHELMAFYTKCFPDTARMPFQATPAWTNQILQELAGTFKRDLMPAAISYTAQKTQPSLLWSKAFAAIWRFGMDVRFCRITDFDALELSRATKASDKPSAIFLDQIDKLWDPQIVEAVEYVIQQAYNAHSFIWLEFVHEPAITTGAHETLDVRQTLTRRLSKLKDKHPLDHLSRDALSRLESMSGIHHKSGNSAHA